MKLLREPLVQFLVLGAVVFAVHALVRERDPSDPRRRIEITRDDVRLLADLFTRQWRRPPDEEELRALVDSRVREEVLYREALAVGLDRDDSVVRRRMVQKIEMLSRDLAVLADPTDAELRDFLAEREEDYRVPPRLRFRQVYFNPEARGGKAEAADDARTTLARLRERARGAGSEPGDDEPTELGDRLLLDVPDVLLSPREITRFFGDRFADAIIDLEPGWHGPIASGYGLHLVRVLERTEGRRPELSEIRERLVTDFDRHRAQQARDAIYEGLAESYEIAVEDGALQKVLSGESDRE